MITQAHFKVFVLLIFSVVLFYLTYLFSFRSVIVHDYGILIDQSYRIFKGQIMYKDFYFPTTPLTFMIQAALFKIFNPDVFWMKIYLAVMNTILYFIAILLCTKVLKLSSNILLWIVVPITIAWSPGIMLMRPWYDFDANFFAFTALFFLALGSIREKNYIFLIAGFCAGLSACSKQNIGAGSILSAFLFILLQPSIKREKLMRSFFFGLGLLIIASIFCAYFIYHDALREAINCTIVRASQRASNYNYFVQALRVIFRTDNNFIKLTFFLYITAIILCWKERKINIKEGSVRLGIVLYSFITMWFGCLAEQGNDYPHQQIYLGVLLGIWCSSPWVRGEMPFSLYALIKAPKFLFTIFLASLTFFWPIYKHWRITFKFNEMKWSLNHGRIKGLNFIHSDYQYVESLLEFEKTIPKNETIFLFPDPVFFYFATGRLSPIRQIGFVISNWENPLDEVKHIEDSLNKKDVKWVIIARETSFDFGHLRFGDVSEDWKTAVNKGIVMSSRGDYSFLRNFIDKNYVEVPNSPLGYWVLKKKTL